MYSRTPRFITLSLYNTLCIYFLIVAKCFDTMVDVWSCLQRHSVVPYLLIQIYYVIRPQNGSERITEA